GTIMAVQDLKTFASLLALYVRQNLDSVHRGALLIRCVADGSVVAAVFGNDGYMEHEQTRREVALVRQQLRDSLIEELGFGLTPRVDSWAVRGRTDCARFRPAAGQAFHVEMFKAYLEDTVQAAWQIACGGEPGDTRSLFPSSRPPL